MAEQEFKVSDLRRKPTVDQTPVADKLESLAKGGSKKASSSEGSEKTAPKREATSAKAGTPAKRDRAVTTASDAETQNGSPIAYEGKGEQSVTPTTPKEK